MDYELAKELKEAGFPQKWQEGMSSMKEPTYFPSLSELIEACGGRFGALGKDDFRHPWYCCSKLTAKGEWLGPYGHGSTPEEAVGRLLLALYKK